MSAALPVEVRGVDCRRGRRTVLAGVDLAVPAGGRLALVGPNGAGKSTLLRVLTGVDSPAAGSVHVGGDDLHALPARRRARTLAAGGQEEIPSAELTLAEAVALGRTPHRNPWSVTSADEQETVRAALERVGLGGRGDQSCTRLSGGERHRVVLARVLAQQTPVVVLDEPTNHLDASWRLGLMAMLDALDCTLVAAMHDLDLVLRHFDAVAVLAGGGLVAHGPPAEILRPELMRAVFGVESDVVTHPRTGRAHLLLTASTDHPGEGNRP